MPLISALRRQRQEDLCEFEASLVYRVGARTTRAVIQTKPVLVYRVGARTTRAVIQTNPVSKTNKQINK
ncbi:hypothetical protein I79_021706 [Cricetulus griseus]|uniref:Uncharacterized protein n=1 Tax=Cricetulus griseus TaxID=10029 RepID=G3IDD0_CRIGR|nr:hypothetical protein I79_021706 [Cricetulus griseus]